MAPTRTARWRIPLITAPCMVGASIAFTIPTFTAPTLISYSRGAALQFAIKAPLFPPPSWGGLLVESAAQTVSFYGFPTGIFIYPLSALVSFALTACAAGLANLSGAARRRTFLWIGASVGIVAHGAIMIAINPSLPPTISVLTIVALAGITGLATAAVLWPFSRRARLQHVVRSSYGAAA